MSENQEFESLNPFRRARLRGTEQGRIRRLRGFIKGIHSEPDRHSSAAEAFARRTGAAEVAERAETLFREIRKEYRWKRKDLSFHCEGGTAMIRTPDFTVTLWIDQDPLEARSYLIGIEVGSITSRQVVSRDGFINLFRRYCSSVLIDFSRAIDLDRTIDRIEESAALAPLLDYAADASWLTLKAPALSVEMELRPDRVCFSIPPGGDLRALIEGTSTLLEDLNTAGAVLSLD